MYKSGRFLAASAAFCLAAQSGSPLGAEPLQPAKPWVLDYDQTQCVALRDYGPEGHSISLLIRPSPLGGTYELNVMKEITAGPFAEEDLGSIDFGKGRMKASVLYYQNVHDKLQIAQFRIDAAQMEQAKSATSVIFRVAEAQAPISLALRSMPELLKSLDQCNVDLRRYWNMDVKLSQPARGDIRNIFTSDDYPDIAIVGWEQGISQFLLFVDTDGRVADCHVIKRTGAAVLDATGCAIIKRRAKFIPARDASGKAVRDAVVTPPIVWHISNAHG